MINTRITTLLCTLLLANISLAQCLTNGVDSSKCYASFPFPTVNFAIEKKMETQDLAAVYTSPLVIDTDGDCIPEIIMAATNGWTINPIPRVTSDIKIVNSLTGQTISTIPTVFYSWNAGNSYAVADIDLDGLVEIIVAAADVPVNVPNLRGRLICYELDGSVKWVSDQPFGANTLYNYGGTVGLADFNQDSIPEVYIYNELFNAQNGVKLAEGGPNGLGLSRDVSPPEGSLAVGIAGQFDTNPADLELACGYTLYQVTITNPNGTSGNTMIPLSISVDGVFRDGYTSMADVDQNGQLDVIVASRGDQNTGRLYVYSYAISGSLQLLAQTTLPTGGGPQIEHIGTPFIGDMDGSGSPTIGISRPYKLLAYSFNGTTTLNTEWELPTNDASGETGLTMFDFNQDGIQELVYRDMSLLRIIDASTGTPNVLSTFPCTSGTGIERPIVVDLYGNGESQICVTCGPSGGGKVEVFSAPTGQQQWAPSRSIWNQYSYHVFNIENDLTVPAVINNNASASNGLYNNFFVQMTMIDALGNYLQNAADAIAQIDCINYNPSTNSIEVNYQVINAQNASSVLNSGSLVSLTSNGIILNQQTLTTGLSPGNSEVYTTTVPVTALNPNFPIELSVSPANLDCDSMNNSISKLIAFQVETSDTVLCADQTLVFNGTTITQSGTYIFEFQDTNGCDSLIQVVNVTFNPIHAVALTVTQCDSVSLNNQTFYTSGNYEQMLQNSFGCDSLISLNLTIHHSTRIEDSIVACSPFIWNEYFIEESNLYTSYFTDQHGCDSIRELAVFMVPENEMPIANFTIVPEHVFFPDGEITVVNLSVNNHSNWWSFGDGGSFSNQAEPVHQYMSSGVYTIELVVQNSFGCLDTSSQQISVNDAIIAYVPNTFTPDNGQFNTTFYPVFSSVEQVDFYHFSIYNRWGELIYESFDKYASWDGTYQHTICKTDVYNWVLEYSTIYTSAMKKLTGHVALLK